MSDDARGPLYVIRDPCGLAQGLITLSPIAMFILSLMDGEHRLLDIQALHYLLPK